MAGLGHVVRAQLVEALGQARGTHQLLEVRIVEPLLRAEGDLPLHLLDTGSWGHTQQ